MGHDHHHHHNSTGNIRFAFSLNLAFALIELVGGVFTNSIAILSDALHDLGDSISLGIAWYLQGKSTKPADSIYTYGYKRFSLLGAFLNSIILVVGSIFIIKEAIERVANPQASDAKGMIVLAIAGIAFNAIAMLRLKKGDSINEKVVSLHFLEDVLGWVAVLISALVMLFFEIPILDPLLSMAIALFILFNVYRNLKPVLKIVSQAVPDSNIEEKIKTIVLEQQQVQSLHDFHLWSLDGEHHVASMHIVVAEMMTLKEAEQLKFVVKQRLEELHIFHATIEVEYQPEHCNIN